MKNEEKLIFRAGYWLESLHGKITGLFLKLHFTSRDTGRWFKEAFMLITSDKNTACSKLAKHAG